MCEEKFYYDSDVRGEKVKSSELFFTENAKSDYNKLNGSQKNFVDQELDELINAKNIPREIILKDLDLNIFLKQSETRKVVTKISANGFEDSESNQVAIKRAKSWNN